jgi:hypothetical protein
MLSRANEQSKYSPLKFRGMLFGGIKHPSMEKSVSAPFAFRGSRLLPLSLSLNRAKNGVPEQPLVSN